MAKRRKNSASKSSIKRTPAPRSSRGGGGKYRRAASAIGRGLVPAGTGGLAIGALGAILLSNQVLDRIPFTQKPGIGRTLGRFALGIAGYQLINRALKKPAIAQGFYVASLAVVAGEGYNLARAALAKVRTAGMGAGTMPTRTGDVRFDSPGASLVGGGGVNRLAATSPDRDFVVSTDGRVLEVVN
jgi:hypothetical protein